MNFNEFKNPGSIYRPAPFWSWNDKLDEKELERQIQEMADKGWGGYFMHSRVGLITEYLSNEWMELVKACAEKAKETNTYAWLYDEINGHLDLQVEQWLNIKNTGVVPWYY